jgi:hypothetical protein
VLSLRTAEIATEIEEIVLNMGQDVANIRVAYMQQDNADDRVRFVDAAVGRYAHVELRQPRSIAERSATVVAGASLNPIEFHGGLPMRSSWTPRSRSGELAKALGSLQAVRGRNGPTAQPAILY